MWYHLECIGIRSIRDLGREEDPWFCSDCQLPAGAEREEEEEEELYREPTFAPTDMDYPSRRRGYDAIFAAGAIEDSPAFLPRTPRSYDHYENLRSTLRALRRVESSSVGHLRRPRILCGDGEQGRSIRQ